MQITDLDDSCVIKWRLTDACNYHCSYCIRRPLVKDAKQPKVDFDMCLEALPHVVRICEELNYINQKPIKIDLIGGEISIFDNLSTIFEELYKCIPVQKVNLTTNLSRPIEYYTKLNDIALNYDKKLSMTASFHPEFTDLDTIMEKCKTLYELLGSRFKCETVITDCNNQVEEFINRCEALGCYYMCEEDLLDSTKHGTTVKNYKPSNRYKVIHDDGSIELYSTRNEVIKKFGKKGLAMNTAGMACTRDHDYVYIEQNVVMLCGFQSPISNYRISEYPRYCVRGECTLCGHMSVFHPNTPSDKQ